ncbi:ABC transporter substrate-binding protein [Chromobacterium sp. IIBBL 290-4]|uniref:substrate-binding periplasmic protein n=1 Tax=Chromobacterium sp. IIBBL 290-4 TaxID=2953890 RepID=UPI0020B88439|nr:transporter substrate-binding domain-containing protein [Chromobacterium sp. IIBBL 290-4]UTH73250.1 transporter substrate-binding domain-containing protein [Chromobacterium sp. IIBBL 290-4]
MRIAALMLSICLLGPGAAWPAGPPPLELATLQYPPYQYQDGAEVRGFAADIVREAFRRMGVSIHIAIYPWGRALAMAQEGREDGIFTLFRTPEREARLDFCHEPLAAQTVSLFVRKGSPIHFNGNLDELSAYRFGVVRSVNYGAAFDLALRQGRIHVGETAASGEQNLDMLLANRFDILVSNRLGAWDIIKRRGVAAQVGELKPPLEDIPSYLAFARKPALAGLRDRFDAALQAMRRDGAYARIQSEASP